MIGGFGDVQSLEGGSNSGLEMTTRWIYISCDTVSNLCDSHEGFLSNFIYFLCGGGNRKY